MSSNYQQFLEPQDLLENFVEVKFKPNHNNRKHGNKLNQLNYWRRIFYSVVVLIVVDIVLRSLLVLPKYKN